MMNISNKQKGFTLIELMIVVAIIGILAAIAIPQFSSYRVKAFNSSAQADLRNLMTAEEAVYSDNQVYLALTLTTNTGPLNITTLPGAKLSKGVNAEVKVATTTATTIYSAATKHKAGNIIYTGTPADGIVETTGSAAAAAGTALTAQ